MSCCGIDLHKGSIVICVIDESGKQRLLVRLPTSERNLIDVLTSVHADRKLVTIEEIAPTRWAVTLLKPWCDDVFSCDPKHNAWIANDPHKDDENDCEKLARLLRMDELKRIFHQDDDDRYAFKIAVQHFHEMKDEVVRAKNKIKAHLLRAGVIDSDGAKVFTKKNRKHYLSLVPKGPWINKLDRLYRHYDWLEAEKAKAKTEYEEAGRKYREIEQFMKILGIGTEIAHTFSAIIQDANRFGKVSEVYRYCALSISGKSSDGKALGYERLEKNTGHTLLKSMSYRAFVCGIAHEGPIKAYYQAALAENGGNGKRARLTTQRKIIQTMWVIWKNGTDYNPDLFVHSVENPATNKGRTYIVEKPKEERE